MNSALSDDKAESAEDSGMSANSTKTSKALLDAHHRYLVQVSVVLDLAVEHVCGGTFNSQVDLVLPEALRRLAHPVVGPASIPGTVQILVVLNGCESLLQDVRVQKWVQSVTRHGQSID